MVSDQEKKQNEIGCLEWSDYIGNLTFLTYFSNLISMSQTKPYLVIAHQNVRIISNHTDFTQSSWLDVYVSLLLTGSKKNDINYFFRKQRTKAGSYYCNFTQRIPAL